MAGRDPSSVPNFSAKISAARLAVAIRISGRRTLTALLSPMALLSHSTASEQTPQLYSCARMALHSIVWHHSAEDYTTS